MPEPLNEKALLPCPFCGDPAQLEQDSDHHGEWFNLGCSNHWGRVDPDVACPGARLWYTKDLEAMDSAIAAWNRRAIPAGDYAGLVERLLSDIAHLNKIVNNVRFGGDGLAITVREPVTLLKDLGEAAAAIAVLSARAEAAEAARDKAIVEMGEQAHQRGIAEGKLRASEMAGVVEGWMERAEAAEARVKELEALMLKAHAVMKACGWRVATECEPIADGLLEAACFEVHNDFDAALSRRATGGE